MFQTSKRPDGTEFSTLIESRPEWLQEAVREAHGDMLPCDWVYAECRAAYEAEEDLTDPDELHSYADGRVEIYTQELFRWAAEMCLTGLYAEAEAEANDLGPDPKATIEDRFKAIQYCAIQQIAGIIAAAKAEHANDN